MLKLLLGLLLPVACCAQSTLLVTGNVSDTAGLCAAPLHLKAAGSTDFFNPTSTVTVTADAMLVSDGITLGLFRSISFVANMNVAGPAADGRDQAGAFPDVTWVYLYAIWGPGTQVHGLWSLSPTSPTLPFGYTHPSLVSAAVTSVVGPNVYLLNSFTQVDRDVVYSDTLLPTIGNSLVIVPLSLADVVPPIALRVSLGVGIIPHVAGGYVNIENDAVHTGASSIGGPVAGVGVGTFGVSINLLTPQTIFYNVSNHLDQASLQLYGWSF